jgi:hypothetical protein
VHPGTRPVVQPVERHYFVHEAHVEFSRAYRSVVERKTGDFCGLPPHAAESQPSKFTLAVRFAGRHGLLSGRTTCSSTWPPPQPTTYYRSSDDSLKFQHVEAGTGASPPTHCGCASFGRCLSKGLAA